VDEQLGFKLKIQSKAEWSRTGKRFGRFVDRLEPTMTPHFSNQDTPAVMNPASAAN
jgi:hypothetical protein